jgi:hypothetical protein
MNKFGVLSVNEKAYPAFPLLIQVIVAFYQSKSCPFVMDTTPHCNNKNDPF